MQKITIFIISGKSPVAASGGGYSTYSYNLARIIKNLRHPLYILSLGEENSEREINVGKIITLKANVPFLNVGIYALPGLPIYALMFANKIRKIVNENKLKKFIVWGIGPWGLTGSILKLFFKKRVIHLNNYFTTTRHEWWGGVRALRIEDYGIWPKLKYLAIYLTAVQYLALLEKIVFNNADVIITNYKSTEEILKKEFKVNSKRFYRAHFYVQVYKRKAQEAKSSKYIRLPKQFILFMSRQDPRKGVNFLLHAYKTLLLMGHKIPLYIAGAGDMLPLNKRLAEKLKISGHVRFLGFVNDPKPLMKACSIFVFPSIEEGAGALTVNEAMEMGIPIVSTACDGIVEDITNEREGLLVPLENPLSMARAIARLLDNPKLAKTLSKNARKRYLKDFSYENMKKDIKPLLVSLKSK